MDGDDDGDDRQPPVSQEHCRQAVIVSSCDSRFRTIYSALLAVWVRRPGFPFVSLWGKKKAPLLHGILVNCLMYGGSAENHLLRDDKHDIIMHVVFCFFETLKKKNENKMVIFFG